LAIFLSLGILKRAVNNYGARRPWHFHRNHWNSGYEIMKKVIDRIVPVVILLAVGYWIVSGIISDRRADAEKQELEAEKIEAEIKTAEKHLQIEKSIKEE
jgi:hypothetical protein